MKLDRVDHAFVDRIPESLDAGVVYVCIPCATVVHRCCCGCGEEVVLPLSPTDWKLVFDGETITLYPSVGSWALACRSHYWIRENRIRWARQWSDEEIADGRARDRDARQQYFGDVRRRSLFELFDHEGSEPEG